MDNNNKNDINNTGNTGNASNTGDIGDNAAPQSISKKGGINDPDLAMLSLKRQKCRNCRQVIETKGDVCPNCGHYLFEKEVQYEPIKKKTANKIKLILGVVLIAVFAALVYFGVFKLEACQAAEAFSLL